MLYFKKIKTLLCEIKVYKTVTRGFASHCSILVWINGQISPNTGFPLDSCLLHFLKLLKETETYLVYCLL